LVSLGETYLDLNTKEVYSLGIYLEQLLLDILIVGFIQYVLDYVNPSFLGTIGLI